MIARIKAIMRRTSSRDREASGPKTVVNGDLKLDCDSRRVYIAGREVNLTAREFDLLELLALNPNKVYSRENLLKLVLKGTSTAFVGDFANFVVGCSLVLPASILYYIKKSKKMAMAGLALGTLVMTVFGSAFNAFNPPYTFAGKNLRTVNPKEIAFMISVGVTQPG